MNDRFLKKAAAFTAAICILASASACSADKEDDSSSAAANTEPVPEITLTPAEDAPDSADSEGDAPKEDNASSISPALWLATSPEGDTMYMMGSMHALKDECYPLPSYVTEAYEQADILAVECDISDTTASFAAGLKQMDNMYYDDGSTLADHISEEIYNNLDSYLEEHGDDISTYELFRPWYLSSVLESYAMTDAGLNASYGLDITLLKMAKESGKEIYEVESIDFQMDMLLGFSDELYELMIMDYSADNIEEINELYEMTYEAWKTGDIDAIDESDDENLEQLTSEQRELYDDYNKTMLYDRNIGMAEKVKELISGDKNVLYVVGAAHFAGEGGIIDLLERDGYTFERVDLR